MGPPHDGFEFLKGSFEGLKGYAVGRMTKSRRGKLYIDDAGWGPEAGSIEFGYRVCRGYTPRRKPARSITRLDLAVYLRPGLHLANH